MVYDLGGGTFDVSILELGDGVFEVKATNGNNNLGGDDFDNKVIDWMADEFKKSHGIDLKSDKMALQRLKEAAEKAKIELSSVMKSDINLPFITATAEGPQHLELSLTRAKFDELTSGLVRETEGPVSKAMSDAGLGKNELNKVILVGGSTRIPAVQDAVKNLTGEDAYKGINPDECVAIGAAIQGGVLAGEVNDVLLLDVTPLSLGIETLGGVFTKLIERNTTIPTKKSQVFSTAADNQTAVDIHVLQGEREMASGNKTLGRFQLTGIPAARRGIPQIEVTFDIDANGIVNVSAKDLGTGKSQNVVIKSTTNMSEDDIDKAVKEAEQHAAEDKKAKDLIEAKNNADSTAYQAEQSLKDMEGKITDDEKSKVTAAIDKVKTAGEGEDVEAINKAIEELNEALYPIAQKMYEQTAQEQTAEQQSADQKGDDDVVEAEYEEVSDDDK